MPAEFRGGIRFVAAHFLGRRKCEPQLYFPAGKVRFLSGAIPQSCPMQVTSLLRPPSGELARPCGRCDLRSLISDRPSADEPRGGRRGCPWVLPAPSARRSRLRHFIFECESAPSHARQLTNYPEHRRAHATAPMFATGLTVAKEKSRGATREGRTRRRGRGEPGV